MCSVLVFDIALNFLHHGPLCLLLLMRFRTANPVQVGVWFISPHDVRDDSKQTCSYHTICLQYAKYIPAVSVCRECELLYLPKYLVYMVHILPFWGIKSHNNLFNFFITWWKQSSIHDFACMFKSASDIIISYWIYFIIIILNAVLCKNASIWPNNMMNQELEMEGHVYWFLTVCSVEYRIFF